MNEWPGGPPLVSFGDNIKVNIDGYTVESRQNHPDVVLAPSSIAELSPNRLPLAHKVSRVSGKGPEQDLQALDIDVPFELFGSLHRESQILEGYDIFEPAKNQLLATHHDRLLWGNGATLEYYKYEKLMEAIDIGSPILQVDPMVEWSPVLLRTRLGLSLFDNKVDDPVVKPIYQGDTMNVSNFGFRASLSLQDGSLMVLDLHEGKLVFGEKIPRVDLFAWSKSLWFDANNLVYMNENELRQLDLRTKELSTLESKKKGTKKRDMMLVGDQEIFLLEEIFFKGYDRRMMNKPLLQFEHFLSQKESSWRLSGADLAQKSVSSLFISSSTRSDSLVFSPGKDHGFEVSMADPYLVPLWPNIYPQSQLFLPSEDDDIVNRYVSSVTGGLFRQTLVRGGTPDFKVEDDELGNVLTPEPIDQEESAWRFNEKPLDSTKTVELNAAGSELFRLSPTSRGDGGAWRALGYANESEFERHLNKVWIEPVSKAIANERKPFVERIVCDMSNIKPAPFSLPLGNINPKILAEFEDWPDVLETTPGENLKLSPELQPVDFPQSQIVQDDISFSQPLVHTKKEPRKKKNRDKSARKSDGLPSSDARDPFGFPPSSLAFPGPPASQTAPMPKKKKHFKHRESFVVPELPSSPLDLALEPPMMSPSRAFASLSSPEASQESVPSSSSKKKKKKQSPSDHLPTSDFSMRSSQSLGDPQASSQPLFATQPTEPEESQGKRRSKDPEKKHKKKKHQREMLSERTFSSQPMSQSQPQPKSSLLQLGKPAKKKKTKDGFA